MGPLSGKPSNKKAQNSQNRQQKNKLTLTQIPAPINTHFSNFALHRSQKSQPFKTFSQISSRPIRDQANQWLTWRKRSGRSSWPSMKARRVPTRSRGASRT